MRAARSVHFWRRLSGRQRACREDAAECAPVVGRRAVQQRGSPESGRLVPHQDAVGLRSGRHQHASFHHRMITLQRPELRDQSPNWCRNLISEFLVSALRERLWNPANHHSRRVRPRNCRPSWRHFGKQSWGLVRYKKGTPRSFLSIKTIHSAFDAEGGLRCRSISTSKNTSQKGEGALLYRRPVDSDTSQRPAPGRG